MNCVKSILLTALAVAATSTSALAAERDLSCHLTFTTSEWSAIYASAAGKGEVTCDNGESLPVTISAKGVGLTAGKWEVQEGKGRFTHVSNIEETLGNYYGLSANIGMAKAGSAQALSKGAVSLTVTGTGQGFDVGISISSFTITKASETK